MLGCSAKRKKKAILIIVQEKNNLYLLQWNTSAVGNSVSSRLICSK
jgi:hypothetical protein